MSALQCNMDFIRIYLFDIYFHNIHIPNELMGHPLSNLLNFDTEQLLSIAI